MQSGKTAFDGMSWLSLDVGTSSGNCTRAVGAIVRICNVRSVSHALELCNVVSQSMLFRGAKGLVEQERQRVDEYVVHGEDARRAAGWICAKVGFLWTMARYWKRKPGMEGAVS